MNRNPTQHIQIWNVRISEMSAAPFSDPSMPRSTLKSANLHEGPILQVNPNLLLYLQQNVMFCLSWLFPILSPIIVHIHSAVLNEQIN